MLGLPCARARACVCLLPRRVLGRSLASLFACADACVRSGKLEWGEFGSNECPDGSSVIDDADQCRAAAATAGKNWGGIDSPSSAYYPRGCYTQGGSLVFLNTDQIGSANPGCSLLCAVAATGLC